MDSSQNAGGEKLVEKHLFELREKVEKLEGQIQELNKKHMGLIDFVLNNQASSTGAATPISPLKTKPTLTEDTGPSAFDKGKDFLSSHLLPIVSVICFVLAAIFIVKLAMDSGWLNLERQWGLLNLLGVSLIGYGMFGSFIQDVHYRSYLASAGMVVLYIAALACHLYFGLFSIDFSILMVIIISVAGVFLSRYFHSEVFLVITSVGTYLAPILLGEEKDLTFYAFFFVISSMAFATISIYLGSRVVSLVSSYFGLGAFALIHKNVSEPSDLVVIIGVEVLQFLIFTYGTYLYSVTNKSYLTKKMAMAFMPLLIFFYGTTYYFLDRWDARTAPWISLGFAGFLFFLYYRAKKHLAQLESQQLVFGFMSLVLAHSGYMQLLPSEAKPWLIPLVLVLMIVANRKADFPFFAPILKWTFFAIAALEYGKLCISLMSRASDWKSTMPALTAVVLGFFYYAQGSKHIARKEHIYLGLVHMLAILMLYQLSYEAGTLAVSFVWAIYSISILSVGYIRREVYLAKSSLLVLVLAGLKALVYDASQAPSSLRIFSLLLTGALLYGAGVVLKRINQWAMKEPGGLRS